MVANMVATIIALRQMALIETSNKIETTIYKREIG